MAVVPPVDSKRSELVAIELKFDWAKYVELSNHGLTLCAVGNTGSVGRLHIGIENRLSGVGVRRERNHLGRRHIEACGRIGGHFRIKEAWPLPRSLLR